MPLACSAPRFGVVSATLAKYLAWAARVALARPRATNRSIAYCRTVSSKR
jgi:hypothetical protein